jgi:hypothetical protein
LNTISRVDTVSTQYISQIDGCHQQLVKTAMIAKAIKKLRELIDPLKDVLMELQGSDLGFRTDKDVVKGPDGTMVKGPGYPWEVVKTIVVEALLKRVRPFGNEFNIISGRLYITQEGYRRSINDLPDVKGFVEFPGVPELVNGRTIVTVDMQWERSGKKENLSKVFPVKMHSTSTDDQIVGKAKRKALKAAYEYLTGTAQPDNEPEDDAAGVLSSPNMRLPSKEDVESIRQLLFASVKANIFAVDEFKAWLKSATGFDNINSLTLAQLNSVRGWVDNKALEAASKQQEREPGQEG